MAHFLKISEACSIAIHVGAVLSANREKIVSVKDMLSVLDVSETHLQKVLQRLVKAKLVGSCRGPSGGFYLDGKNPTLLNIYEAIEGRLSLNDCLFEKKLCGKNKCIFDKLLKRVHRDFYKYLAHTKLSTLKKNQWKIL